MYNAYVCTTAPVYTEQLKLILDLAALAYTL